MSNTACCCSGEMLPFSQKNFEPDSKRRFQTSASMSGKMSESPSAAASAFTIRCGCA